MATTETHKNRDRPPRDLAKSGRKCVILPLVEISEALDESVEDRHIDARQGNQRDFGDKKAIFPRYLLVAGNEQEIAGGDGQAKRAPR